MTTPPADHARAQATDTVQAEGGENADLIAELTANVARWRKFAAESLSPYNRDEWLVVAHQCEKAAAALSTQERVRVEDDAERMTPGEAWNHLCEMDDRTSPEGYPDHCLITKDELARYMRAALAQKAPPMTDSGKDLAKELRADISSGEIYSPQRLALMRRAAAFLDNMGEPPASGLEEKE